MGLWISDSATAVLVRSSGAFTLNLFSWIVILSVLFKLEVDIGDKHINLRYDGWLTFVGGDEVRDA